LSFFQYQVAAVLGQVVDWKPQRLCTKPVCDIEVSCPFTVSSILFELMVWNRIEPIERPLLVLITFKRGLVDMKDGMIVPSSLAIRKSAKPVSEFQTSSLPTRNAGIRWELEYA
jgi:hypothetical protein